METFAVVIPDRGDRPEFITHCKRQISRMTVQPNKIYHINWPAVDKKIDLVERVYDGVKMAESEGFDLVFIIENDDYYPPDYFEQINMSGAAFFGNEQTWYYNVKTRAYSSFYHMHRSSLFVTGFRISYMKGFQWSGDQFLDLRIWDWAKKNKFSRDMSVKGAIGIKHGVGLCGGKGHKIKLKYPDPDMQWLKSRVDQQSFDFYKTISDKI